MSVKDIISEEKKDLLKVKRPYETAAFLIFSIMFVRQMFFWVINLIKFIGASTFFSTNLPTTPAFVIQLINLNSTKWIWVIVGFLGLVLWYFLIYLFVWNYCRVKGYAKWTWTALIAFLPTTLFLVPVYIWYAIYVFRPYIMRFIKKAVEEYKAFDPNAKFPEEVDSPVEVVEDIKEENSEETVSE